MKWSVKLDCGYALDGFKESYDDRSVSACHRCPAREVSPL